MPSNSSTHHDFLTNNEANEVLILMTLISYLKWTSICVFYEEGTGEWISLFMSHSIFQFFLSIIICIVLFITTSEKKTLFITLKKIKLILTELLFGATGWVGHAHTLAPNTTPTISRKFIMRNFQYLIVCFLIFLIFGLHYVRRLLLYLVFMFLEWCLWIIL